MKVEPKSLAELGEFGVLTYWPKLNTTSYHKTSDETINYNCVAWVNRIQHKRVDFSEDEEGNPVSDPYYLTSGPYIEYFQKFGFEHCIDGNLEEGIEKIAIFEKDGQFKHVASQLSNGNWTSKIGEYEDIEHYTVDAVEGHFYKRLSYGTVTFYMKRKRVF